MTTMQDRTQGRTRQLGPDLEQEIIRGNAIRCLECNYIGTRLQWTHFKNRCSVSSITSYRAKYPQADLVAPNLKSRLSISLANLIAKHGEIDGPLKWDIYRAKQAATNSLDYKVAKYGWN